MLLKSRDSKAFNYLYDNYSSALYTTIAQVVNNLDVVNDILQEVFINIWRKIDTYDPAKGRLFTWMLNIARNASIDTMRSKNYQNSRKNVSMPDDNVGGSAYEVPTSNIDNIGFKKVLQKLSNEHRVLIELSYFKGYTHEEIAQILSVPLGTVKTRIRTALTHLRKILN